ncbi:hypothetical protein GLOIN_2v1763409 [Rhizophagus clarus]|uniref:Uncharacterized protein n=1 Tax=Rhizophagus clarus TaxID=94130 RepID=A0A8H3KYJ2_9GLOM|nr:hypothetical protein GLOIN_2v1763409 [Rhizophagus clarus]
MYFLIPTLNTQEVLMIVLNKIQLCDEPGAAAWTKDKLDPWVLSGRDFDKRQWENLRVYEQYNVPDPYEINLN